MHVISINKPMRTKTSKRLNYILYIIVVTIVVLFGFNIYFTFQFHGQIAHIVSNPGKWPAGAYEYDPVIGFDFEPNISAPVRDRSFYVKSHQYGYRVGQYESAKEFQPGGLISLGCSFTYGDEVESEQTFTQLIADSLGLDAYNYGVSSFSYIHALLKARKLKEQGILDKLRPEYVILGCWWGLLDRSRSPYPPVLSQNMPLIAAHITKDDKELQIESPANIDKAFALIKLYRKEGTGMSMKKFTRLFVLAPRFLLLTMTMDKGDTKKGGMDEVTDLELYNYYFTGITEIFSDYGSKIIVLYMPHMSFDLPGAALLEALKYHPDIILADGLQAVKHFNIPPTEYEKRHPQPKAHEAYAWETIKVISADRE